MTGRAPPALALALLLAMAGCAGVFADTGTLRFEEVAAESGLAYEAAESRTMMSGAGAYVADVNGDLRPDVLLTGGAPEDGTDGPALFVNTGGGFERSGMLPEGAFEAGRINAAHFFDHDNDGRPDLVLFPVGAAPIFLENTGGAFERRDVGLRLPEAGGETANVPTGAASADYDRDGDLDLFVYQNGDWKRATPVAYQHPDRPIREDNGNPNVLFENTGDGFERVPPSESGIRGTRWTLAASFVDLTGDGYPDIHVANDFNTDYFYINRGDGTFEQVPAGAATNRNAMASEVADVNRDGRPDVFATNIYFEESATTRFGENYLENVLGKEGVGNNLLINRGGGEFEDRAAAYGLKRGGWGWAAAIVDLDNDGALDAIHTTRAYSDTLLAEALNATDPASYYKYPAVWRGGEDGFAARNASRLGFEPTNGRGLATLDYDGDGDLDLIVAQWAEGDYRLYENVGASGDWLRVALEGNATQTPIGARVYVTVDGETRMRILNSKADYLSQDSRILHFGLGDAGRIDRLRVVWPDGTERVYEGIEPNQAVVVSIDGGIERGAGR